MAHACPLRVQQRASWQPTGSGQGQTQRSLSGGGGGNVGGGSCTAVSGTCLAVGLTAWRQMRPRQAQHKCRSAQKVQAVIHVHSASCSILRLASHQVTCLRRCSELLT